MTPEETEGFPGVTQEDIALARATLESAGELDPRDGIVWRVALTIRAVREEERTRLLGGDARERIARALYARVVESNPDTSWIAWDDLSVDQRGYQYAQADAALKAIGGER